MLGLGGAVVLLCVLAFFAVQLLEAGGGGLVLGGGLLLLLVSWQMWRDLRAARNVRAEDERTAKKPKTLMRALSLIFIADISTSLDNVLAVAGAARDQPAWVLFVGLALSVALTGFAAVGVARLLHRWPWLGYIGLAVVLFVAGGMLWDGAAPDGLGEDLASTALRRRAGPGLTEVAARPPAKPRQRSPRPRQILRPRPTPAPDGSRRLYSAPPKRSVHSATWASSILRNSTVRRGDLRPAGTRASSAAMSAPGHGRGIGLAQRQRDLSRRRTG